ncbi:hypothetical protein RB597_004564 [Gaeumannomyces tritici]
MRGARGALQAVALLAALLMRPLLATAADGPTFHKTALEHPPYNLNYFEDSDVVLFQDERSGTIFRSDDAGSTWHPVKDIEAGRAVQLVMHAYDPQRAFVLTDGIHHYKTTDRGKSWQSFLADTEMSIYRGEVLNFHAGDPDSIIFNGMDCRKSLFCEEVAMYTTDGFRSDAKFLRGSTRGCWWAKSSKMFATGDDEMDKQRALCIVADALSMYKQDQRLLVSDNYFSAAKADGVIQEFEPNLDTNQPVQGIINVAAVKKFLLVAANSKNTDEMALFVTDDAKKWHRAVFPTDHKLNQEAYTVLESTNYSIQIDVMTTHRSNPMGVLLTSNSNGTYFTRNMEHTNRNHRGHVDFEKISGIQGVFLVNKVANADEVAKDRSVKKKVVTEITFDDGRTFESVTADKEKLHLHSVTDLDNVGRVFSSPAPGLVMANGNTGDHLGKLEDSSLYISDNAGVSWIKGPKGPHKYEFGDQGSVLVAVRDGEHVDEITYSLNHGKDWKTAKLPDGIKLNPGFLTTTQDSTSLKFILVGQDSSRKFYIIAIDFDGLHEATCKDGDMEEWFARVDDKGKPTCIMGHTQKYRRRKKDAECFIKQEFKDPVAEMTQCDCADQDFECDYNFKRNGDKCEASGPVAAPKDACKNAKPDDVFKGSSGWRKIPGDDCKRVDGKQKDEQVEHKCKDSTAPPVSKPSGKIKSTKGDFEGEFTTFEKYYLEKGDDSQDTDETIVARPLNMENRKGGPVFLTTDHGKTWKQPAALKGEGFWTILRHHYFKEMAFFIKESGEVTYTADRGLHFHEFKAPNPVDTTLGNSPLVFHPDRKDWLIWLGKKCEKKTKECYIEASLSEDRGDNWKSIKRYAQRCEFTGASQYRWRDNRQILCLVKSREGSEASIPLDLMWSDDFFKEDKVVQKNVKDFATMAEFIVAAAEVKLDKDKDQTTLQAFASLDGKTYAATKFPYNFEQTHSSAVTVLDSSTHAVNMFVPTVAKSNHKYGTIIKSNSNGTEYVVSISGVNCDDQYYVDFEKMLGLEGVALVNVVANRDKVDEPKKKQTKITHNDGAMWGFLPPPKKDAEGKNFACRSDKGDEGCALHLHGYTERQDRQKTYSSAGAVGLMLGIGNVGPSLSDVKSADTFMTADAGISWTNVKKGAWSWAFGDRGSIVVLVPKKKTKTVSYSTDEGRTWADYEFTSEEVEVEDISTLNSGGSRNFLLWCKKGKSVFTVNLDFTGLSSEVCKYDEKDDSKSDYYLWKASHPLQQDVYCLFGHKSSYLRKKTDRSCYNGNKIQQLRNIEICECTRQDFECDFNFELGKQNGCQLVPGFQPMSKEEWCTKYPGEDEWFEPTGYRRIPLSTCKGGRDLENSTTSHACPGHEKEYEQRHPGPGGFVIFLIILLSFGGAGAVGWWVFQRWEAGGSFGQIRLGEHPSGGGLLDADSPWVRYPVVAVSATVALVGALPMVASALWRTATSAAERWGFPGGAGRGAYGALGLGGGGGGGPRRFTTRDSFARGTGDYAGLDEDEGELLGEDSDEEI